MNEYTFVVDLDGTLKTDAGNDGPFEKDSLTVKSGDKTYTFAVRPNIEKFLQACKSRGFVILGTASGKRYASRIIKAMGIEGYFDHIITAHEFQRGYNLPNHMKSDRIAIVIDNDGEMGQLKYDKLRLANTDRGLEHSIWTVDTYGGSINDNTMMELVSEIENLEV